MKEETKQLLFVRGQAKLAELLSNVIEDGDAALEESIIASGKSLDDCWKYITFKARKVAVDGCACVDSDTVFQWAMKFYAQKGEPDDMEKPAPKPVVPATTEKSKKKTAKEKKAENLTKAIQTAETATPEEPESEDTQLALPETAPEVEQPAELEVTEEVSEATADETAEAPEEVMDEQKDSAPAAENIPGEELKCVICGKKMKDAFPTKSVEAIRKWTQGWMDHYSAVFCCKEHMEQYVRESSEVK